ncbi:NAD(P)/FAD-dependent oxidoreductase [Thermodesulfobacteriota bacterium]
MGFSDLGAWIERPADLGDPLSGDQVADVVVIGAGYTGLSTACALREEGMYVVVLDQDFAGSGASGRNAGHATPTIGKDLWSMLSMQKKRGEGLMRFAAAAVTHFEATVERHSIDCDYVREGNILAAVHPDQEPNLHKAVRMASERGIELTFLDGGAMRERGIPSAFRSGILEEAGGVLDPGKFVTGLRRAAIDAGVRLYEQSPVVTILEGAQVVVETDQGRVAADRAVIATNAYTAPTLGRMRSKVAPLRVSLFETEPLDGARLEALKWPGREGIYTAHEGLESYRLTARNTIVGGAKYVAYCYGSRLPEANDPKAFGIIESAFRDRFPELEGIGIAHFWSGWIGFSYDFLPTLGVTGKSRNIYYGLAYAGHGLTQAVMMGSMLRDFMLGRPNEHVETLDRFLFPYPPEPFRWLYARAQMEIVYARDRRVDRRIRSRVQS